MRVSSDERTMIQSWEAVSPKGAHSKGSSLWTRSKPGRGLEGQWSETKLLSMESPKRTLTVKSDGGSGIIIATSYSDNIQPLKTLDDKPYKLSGPTASSKEASAAKLLDDHTLKMTDFRDGEVSLRGRWTISPDGEVQTMVLTLPKGDKTYSVTYRRIS